MFGKKGKMDSSTISLIALGLIVFMAFKGGLFSAGGQPGTTTTPIVVQDKSCDVASTTVTVGKAINKFAPTTYVTTAYHDVVLNGDYYGTYLDGATITLAPDAPEHPNVVQVYYNLNNSAPTYYAAKGAEFSIPCTGALKTSDYDKDAELVANSTMTVTFNNDDGSVNSVSNNQTINTGESRTIKMTLQGAYQNGFSPEAPAMVVIDLNSTQYKEMNVAGKTKTSAPQRHVVTNTGSKAWAFLLDSVVSNERKEYSVTLVAQSSGNPSGSLTTTFYDADWFKDTDTGEYKLAYETNTYTSVGSGGQSNTLYIV